MAQYIEAQVSWVDNSSDVFEETGSEVQIYTDSPSFVANVPVDLTVAPHPWMRLLPAAAAQTTYNLKLELPVTYIKVRVRQFNAHGYGPWDNPSGTLFNLAQVTGANVPKAPTGAGFQVVTPGSVTPTPIPETPPPPPPPPVEGVTANYAIADQFSGEQGLNQWSYRDTAGNELVYNSTSQIWNGLQTYQGLWVGGCHPGTTNGTVLRFTAPGNGTALISGTTTLYSPSSSGIAFKINYNGGSDLVSENIAGGASYTYSETQAMSAGEYIDFIVSPGANNSFDSTSLSPSIVFTTDGSTPSNPVLSSLTPAAPVLNIGGTTSLTVTLTSPAIAAASVSLSSTDTGKVTVPATVTIPVGQRTAQFQATGVAVGSSTIEATYNGTTKSASATVASPVSANWSNAPAGGIVLLDHNFTSVLGPGMTGGFGNGGTTTDASALLSAPNVVVSRLPVGTQSGGGQVNFEQATVYREMYCGLIWRTNPQWTGRLTADKMFFLSGSNSNGFWGLLSGITKGGGNPYLHFSTNSSNINNDHIPNTAGGLIMYPNVQTTRITPGVWVKIEAWIRCSTTLTSRDGAVKWWINGELNGSYENLNYGSTAGGGLTKWIWTETWDGSGTPIHPVVLEHYIDHVYVVGKN